MEVVLFNSCDRVKIRKLQSKSLYSVRMKENTDQKYPEHEYFLLSSMYEHELLFTVYSVWYTGNYHLWKTKKQFRFLNSFWLLWFPWFWPVIMPCEGVWFLIPYSEYVIKCMFSHILSRICLQTLETVALLKQGPV